jgi:hypothetical protein
MPNLEVEPVSIWTSAATPARSHATHIPPLAERFRSPKGSSAHPRVIRADPSEPKAVSYTVRGGRARRMPPRPNAKYTTGPTARATGPHISP